MLVPVALSEACEALRQGREITRPHASITPMRPSIETAMHAVLPHRVVIHVHSINAIAWAIRLDGHDELGARLKGLRWQWIPYVASGVPLAQEIGMALARAKETNVFLLANHGLVICGEDCAETEQLLHDVERRLMIPPRAVPLPDGGALENIAPFARSEHPRFDRLRALATDEVSLRILKGGVLYPCQAIFLGLDVLVVPPALSASRWIEHTGGQGQTPAFVVVEGTGVLLHEKITGAQRATLLGLVEVIRRTDTSMRLRYLTREEVEKVLNEGGRGYRDEAETEESSNPCEALEAFDQKPEAEYNRDTCYS